MKKVVLNQGLPGSGKTTETKETLRNQPGQWKRVNKDDLRAMLDDGHFTRKNEDFVLDLRDHIIIKALDEGKSVIVDDTHLPLEKHYNRIKQVVRDAGFECPIEVDNSFLEVPLEKCIERDLQRSKSVGESVIKKMYNQHVRRYPDPPEYDPNLPEAYVIDLDGTLALHTNRSPFEFEKCKSDEVNQPVLDLVDALISREELSDMHPDPPKYFLFVTGREDYAYNETFEWICENVTSTPDGLFMRPTGDHRKDWVIKKELYEKHIKPNYNVVFVLDDRRQVVDMWRSLGLTCMQVAEGEF